MGERRSQSIGCHGRFDAFGIDHGLEVGASELGHRPRQPLSQRGPQLRLPPLSIRQLRQVQFRVAVKDHAHGQRRHGRALSEFAALLCDRIGSRPRLGPQLAGGNARVRERHGRIVPNREAALPSR